MAEHVEAGGADFLLALALAHEAANETFGLVTTRTLREVTGEVGGQIGQITSHGFDDLRRVTEVMKVIIGRHMASNRLCAHARYGTNPFQRFRQRDTIRLNDRWEG